MSHLRTNGPAPTRGEPGRRRIAVGSDHLGRELRLRVADHLDPVLYEVQDFGCGPETEVDYPDVAVEVAQAVKAGSAERAVLICGTGIGMAMTANKIPGIRAASVADAYSAERASRSNNAQILCLGALVTGVELAFLLVDRWLQSDFGGGGSARKVAKIDALDRHSPA